MTARLPPRPFLYPILDVDALGTRPLGDAVHALAEGGAMLVQLRAKTLPDHALLAAVREAVEAARARRTSSGPTTGSGFALLRVAKTGPTAR